MGEAMITALVLLAQVACSDLSKSNPTLYRPEDGHVACLDWSQAQCQYVERACRPGEVEALCPYVEWACPPAPILVDCYFIPAINGKPEQIICTRFVEPPRERPAHAP